MRIAFDERTNKVGNAVIQMILGCNDGVAHEFPLEQWEHQITPDMHVHDLTDSEVITLKNLLNRENIRMLSNAQPTLQN